MQRPLKCPTGFPDPSSAPCGWRPSPTLQAPQGTGRSLWLRPRSPAQDREVLLNPVLRQRSPRAKDPRGRCILPSLLCPGTSVYVSLYPARPQRASSRILPRASLEPQVAPRAGKEGLKAELDGNQTCPAGDEECRGPQTRSTRGQGSSGVYQVPSKPNSPFP